MVERAEQNKHRESSLLNKLRSVVTLEPPAWFWPISPDDPEATHARGCWPIALGSLLSSGVAIEELIRAGSIEAGYPLAAPIAAGITVVGSLIVRLCQGSDVKRRYPVSTKESPEGW